MGKNAIRERNIIRNMVLAAMFLAIGLLLPFVTVQIPEIGKKLLPMHIPALLCGFICGPWYGAVIGFIMPVLRSLIMGGMPPLVPTAIPMAFELLAYGMVAGLLYRLLKKNMVCLYISLIVAMLAGRMMWYGASYLVYTMMDSVFTSKMFLLGAFMNAIPGIIIQLAIIPPIVNIVMQMNRDYYR